MNQEQSCPACSSEKISTVYDLRGTLILHGIPGLIVRCTECSLLYKRYEAELGTVYAHDQTEESTVKNFFEGHRSRSFFRRILEGVVRKHKTHTNHLRLLDVGSGTGALLEEALNLGIAAQGVERNPVLAKKARAKGLTIHAGTVEDLELPETFDIITLMDVLEHLPDPLDVLRKVKSMLSAGGEIVVYTPNHAAPVVRIAHICYTLGLTGPIEQIFANNHLVFFTQESLARMLETAGFRVSGMIIKPYDPLRPGGRVSWAPLCATTIVEFTGHIVSGSGFRMRAHAQKP